VFTLGGESAKGLPKSLQKRSQILVVGIVANTDLELSQKTSEKYYLTVKSVSTEKVRNEIRVTIDADTFYGYRHGLETLSQLITFDPDEQSLKIPNKVLISDAPIFPFRGILIDTGRNYFSMSSLKRIVDAMSYNKLNVLHWHMNEQQAFPFVSERVPELVSHGAYSKR
jgi:hexosaminidase